MQLIDAIQVVQKLARGIDPVSNEAFPKDGPYNNAVVIRSLFTVLQHLPKQKKSIAERQDANRLKGVPLNTGLPWKDDVREAIALSFKNGKTIEEIADDQLRSRTAIVAELHRQGVISSEQAEKLGYPLRYN